jgi:hypothetical protein
MIAITAYEQCSGDSAPCWNHRDTSYPVLRVKVPPCCTTSPPLGDGAQCDRAGSVTGNTLSHTGTPHEELLFAGLLSETVIGAAAGRPSGRRHPSHPGAWGHQPPSLYRKITETLKLSLIFPEILVRFSDGMDAAGIPVLCPPRNRGMPTRRGQSPQERRKGAAS